MGYYTILFGFYSFTRVSVLTYFCILIVFKQQTLSNMTININCQKISVKFLLLFSVPIIPAFLYEIDHPEAALNLGSATTTTTTTTTISPACCSCPNDTETLNRTAVVATAGPGKTFTKQ